MKLKSLMFKGVAALAAVPALASNAFAFTASTAHRESYNGMTPHEHYDALWHETMIDITVIGVLFTIFCAWLLFAFRRSETNQVGTQPTLGAQARIGWAVIPMVLFLADDLFLFAMGFELHNHYRQVPANATEVKLIGSKWSWEYEYENGVTLYPSISVDSAGQPSYDGGLVVAAGTPVVMRMVSSDVIHSHYMNKYRVTEDLMPGRVTWQWFMPDVADAKLVDGTLTGGSVVTCREYCGTDHSRMFTKVYVLNQADYDAFMATELGEADVAPATSVAENSASSEANI